VSAAHRERVVLVFTFAEWQALCDVIARDAVAAYVAEQATHAGCDEELATEIARALTSPMTATEIAKAVTRRRVDVERVLHAERRFARVAPPETRSRRSKTWALTGDGAGQVGTRPEGDA
jgi:crotonobetainyl-CoA:carnitine CoA-transferase CaiB-like acyl-CoA transferase